MTTETSNDKRGRTQNRARSGNRQPEREQPDTRQPDSEAPDSEAPDSGQPGSSPGGWQAAIAAASQVEQLTGAHLEGITGMRRSDDGWEIEADFVELRRIPSTTDVMATYLVDVGSNGDLDGFRRVHRFVRGGVGDD